MTQSLQIGTPDDLKEDQSQLLEYVADWIEMQSHGDERERFEAAVDDPETPVMIRYDRDYTPITSMFHTASGFEITRDVVRIEIEADDDPESYTIIPNWGEVPDEISPFSGHRFIFTERGEDEEPAPEIDLNEHGGAFEAEDLGITCPGCGTEFDEDEWENTTGGDAWGGISVYECPATGCDCSASFSW